MRKLRVIADTFIFIANTKLNQKTLKDKLSNSKFDLVRPEELKAWIEQGRDYNNKEFNVTPDLSFIMNGKIRDIIEQVSQLIQYSDIRQ